MKKVKNDFRNDIKLLIDISAVSPEYMPLFSRFHKMFLAIVYQATDICIDYDRKRIYMNVIAEDAKGDFLSRVDNLIPTKISLNLTYEKLGEFLQRCLEEKESFPEEYFPLLKDEFIEGKSFEKQKDIPILHSFSA